jgi:hypothetical protein
MRLYCIEKRTQRRRTERRNADRPIATAKRLNLMSRKPIAFVEDKHTRNRIKMEFLQDADHRGNLHIDIGCPDIDDMEQKIRFAQLFQSGAKGPEQFVGEIPDKSDRIGNDDLSILGKTKSATGGIQGLEHPIIRRHLAPREDVEESGFSGIRIADQRQNRQAMPSPARPTLVLMPGKMRELPLKMRNPVPNPPPIGFQLGFTGPSGPDAAAEP